MTDMKKHARYGLIEAFDRYQPYIDRRIDSDIKNHRMGVFSLAFYDAEGNRVYPDTVCVRQISHEFKFGCSLFLLDQFQEDSANEEYRKAFIKVFNCGVVPLYWDTLEPKKGKPRFGIDSTNIWRRPPVDLIQQFCKENRIHMKAHCLAYNAFNPSWLPDSNRDINIELAKRIHTLGERYPYDFEDMDVINEMFFIYKNCYKGTGVRNFQITDELTHEQFCFELAKQNFPCTRLFWNEGCFETFGNDYCGPRSRYYLMLRRQLELGTKIEGIGMQFHAFCSQSNELSQAGILYNSLRALDILDCYSDFNLPIHLSEVSIPSWSNEQEDEEIQAELFRRMLKLWFSRKNVEAVIWWNLVDGTAYGDENKFHAGLLRRDFSPKAAYKALDYLINQEWHTEFSASGKDAAFIFDGFYGDYEIAVTHNGHSYTKPIRLYRDTTGYNNKLADWRLSPIRLI